MRRLVISGKVVLSIMLHNSSVIESVNLTKIYQGNNAHALSDVTLRVKEREVFTLLGRNGAGKTTFLRIATTQLVPTDGSMRVLGHDVVKEAKKVRRRVAVLPQEAHTFPPLTPWDHVYLTLMMRGFSKTEARLRANDALETLELNEYRNTPADRLSAGLRQRVLVAMVIATDADLLFLDEPTLGLDAVNRRKVWNVIKEHCRQGRSILLTTNYLDEAENLSDHLAILDHGKTMAQGTVDDLISLAPLGKVRVDVFSGFTFDELASFGKVVAVADRLRVFTDEDGSRELAGIAVKRRAKLGLSPITLEDVFVDLVGE